MEPARHNLPLTLLDRLLGSAVVPLEAKLKAIESWRRELADAALSEPALDAVASRLVHADTYLRPSADTDTDSPA